MSINEIPRLYTAFAEWSACMIFVALLERRFKTSVTVALAFLCLTFSGAFLQLTGNVPVIWWVPCMIVAVLWMFCTIYMLSKTDIIVAVYCGSWAFLIAEFSASFEWQIESYLRKLYPELPIVSIGVFFLIHTLVFAGFYFLEKHTVTESFWRQLTKKDMFSAIMMAVIVFAFSNLDYIQNKTPFGVTNVVDIAKMRTLVDAFGLALFYSFQLKMCEYLANDEIRTVRTMLKSQYDQYRYYQSSMDIIHIKYHDLKHQIIGLRNEKDSEKRNEWLDKLESELDDNRIVDRTGNQVLDTMLGAKIFQARKNNIRITCVVDGKLLDFMHVTDICTIFGNALDNAIENTVLIADPEKRLIHVTVSSQKSFVLISFSNYFEGELNLNDDNLPGTTKLDNVNHGYGLKSIKYAAEKYMGTMGIKTQDNWFELKLLIPKQ